VLEFDDGPEVIVPDQGQAVSKITGVRHVI
jgi:hypothetical protein